MSLWKKGQLVWIETDRALGPASIVDDKHEAVLRVRILATKELRNYTRRNPPFRRAELVVGQKVILLDQEEVTIREIALRDGLFHFETEDGNFTEADVIALSTDTEVLDLLRQGSFSRAKAFWARRKAWDLFRARESHPLRGAVGCRVQLLPHQLWVLDSALQKKPLIRALLADEVGLGKTIEAGLIFSALHARRQLKRVLVLVPPALKVQWLTESFRRFNIRFRLDHEELIEEDEFRDFIIASFDELENNLANFDLLIVDEAHRLAHDEDRAEALATLVASSRHVLFLSATPRVHGEDAFLAMMEMLGDTPRGPVTPQVFQSKRSELGLPCYRQVEPVFTKDKNEWLTKFLADKLAATKREKVFLIASKGDDVVKLCNELRKKLGQNFALFHEGMDLVERDRQAAYFADPEGAPFLISSEIGGEGRNFQFCHHMVLLDLPADPLVVEQRIGRLDRLGQTQKVSVWCPIEEGSDDEEVFEALRDKYRVFEEPWSGSGLEDATEGELLSTRGAANALDALRVPYDVTKANELLQSVQALSKLEVREFLDSLYDLFGVEVEDFDTHGNWRVAASSLMFVDYFPGLGTEGERVLTFDRAQALAREDMTFVSVDHPEFIESVEFLLNSNEGKVAVGLLPPGSKESAVLMLLEKYPDGVGVQLRSSTGQKYADTKEAPKTWRLPPASLPALMAGYQEFHASLGGGDVDALLLAIGSSAR